jgi:hypothetical protein
MNCGGRLTQTTTGKIYPGLPNFHFDFWWVVFSFSFLFLLVNEKFTLPYMGVGSTHTITISLLRRFFIV